MQLHGNTFKRIAGFAGEVVAETLWPTRCALCDRPGEVLCARCIRTFPYLDWWRACRRCGSPYGFVQCDTCNPVALGKAGFTELPFDRCASAVLFTGDTGHVVRVFKDQGEQRLAAPLAALMAQALPPDWSFDIITFIPATARAFKRRGFDHAQLLADQLSKRMGVPFMMAFKRPATRDQRKLGKERRLQNASAGFEALGGVREGSRVLLVDDVFTTGATLSAAAAELKEAGACDVSCLTFARV